MVRMRDVTRRPRCVATSLAATSERRTVTPAILEIVLAAGSVTSIASGLTSRPCTDAAVRPDKTACGEMRPATDLSTTIGSSTIASRSEEHTSELQSRPHLVCRLLLEKKKKK